MDQHYDWSNTEFGNRVGESINLAVNYVADVLHGFWLAAGQPIPEFQIPLVTYLVSIMTLVVATHSVRWKRQVASEDPQRKNSAAESGSPGSRVGRNTSAASKPASDQEYNQRPCRVLKVKVEEGQSHARLFAARPVRSNADW